MFDATVPVNGRVSKAGVLIDCLNQGIGGVAILGMPSSYASTYREGFIRSSLGDFDLDFLIKNKDKLGITPTEIADMVRMHASRHQIYLPYKEIIDIGIPDYFYKHGVSQAKLLKEVRRQFEFLLETEITNLLISLDMDVLDMTAERITATEYNPFSRIAVLGALPYMSYLMEAGIDSLDELREYVNRYQRLKKARDKARKSQKTFDPEKELEGDIIREKLFNVMGRVERSLSVFPNDNPYGLPGGVIHFDSEGGLRVRHIIAVIQTVKRLCLEHGITIGVKTSKGKLTGMVSELSGLDFEGRSTQAAERLIEELNL